MICSHENTSNIQKYFRLYNYVFTNSVPEASFSKIRSNPCHYIIEMLQYDAKLSKKYYDWLTRRTTELWLDWTKKTTRKKGFWRKTQSLQCSWFDVFWARITKVYLMTTELVWGLLTLSLSGLSKNFKNRKLVKCKEY